MNIVWRCFDALLTATVVVIAAFIAILSWLFTAARNSHRRYVIKTHFEGDEAAYERDQWKHL